MRGNHPPQAYSRQDLLKAMEWLEKQTEHVRAQATSPDALMAVYKKALLYGDSFIEKQSPVSSDAFQADLRGIAAQLGSFSEKRFAPTDRPAPGPTNSPSNRATTANATAAALPASAPLAQAPTSATSHSHEQVQNQNQIYKRTAPVSPLSFAESYDDLEEKRSKEVVQKENIQISIQRQMQTTESINLNALDPLTQNRVKDVKARFNLSRDEEAIRLLIAVAYEKLQKI